MGRAPKFLRAIWKAGAGTVGTFGGAIVLFLFVVPLSAGHSPLEIHKRFIVICLPVVAITTALGMGYDLLRLPFRQALIVSSVFGVTGVVALAALEHLLSPHPLQFDNLDYTMWPFFIFMMIGAPLYIRWDLIRRLKKDEGQSTPPEELL